MWEKLLVTGGSGLLGNKIVNKASENFKVTATYNENPVEGGCESIKLDITQKEEVLRVFKKIHPVYVIHTAAFTDVDKSETEREKAWEVNAEGTRNIAEVCERVGAKMIYISTDFVFDGKRGNYKENDDLNPINWYGRTKLEGEKFVKNYDIEYIIARVSVLYGWNINKLNFATWVINKLENKEKISIVRDQWNSPTFADNCADILLELIKRNENGLFHLAGGERINRFDFAKMISEIFDLNADLIKPVKSNEIKQQARRPMDSSLNVDRIKRGLGTKPFNVEQGLRQMKKQYKF